MTEIAANDLSEEHVGSVIEYGPNFMFKARLEAYKPSEDLWHGVDHDGQLSPMPTPHRVQIWTDDGRSATLDAKEVVRV